MQRSDRHGLIAAALSLGLFCCGARPAIAQVVPPLGQADGFAVLAGSAVTNTGATAVTGDVGVSPGTAITGFPPGTISAGTLHSNDALAQGAQSDLIAAFNNLSNQACNTDLSGADLGGQTLTPGVYCFSSSAQLTGTLTLDAQTNVNAVFIFKIGSTLTTATDASVVVINGAVDCNIFWMVGSSETLGTGTHFLGNTLALTSITLTTGATSHGSLWARTGAVTMDSNQVGICTPITPVTLQSFLVD